MLAAESGCWPKRITTACNQSATRHFGSGNSSAETIFALFRSGSLLVAMATFWYAGDAVVHAFCAWGSGRCRDLAIAFSVAIRFKEAGLTADTAVPIAGRAPVGCDSAVNRSAPKALLSRCRWHRCSAMGCLAHAAACASYFMPRQTRLAPPRVMPPPPFGRVQPSFTHVGLHRGQRRNRPAAGRHQASEHRPSQSPRCRLLGQKSPTGLITKVLLPTPTQDSLLARFQRARLPQPLPGRR